MSGAIIDFMSAHGISHEITIFVISMMPLLECRLGLIAAMVLKVPVVPAALLCYIGNILPLPFILLFIKQIFKLMRRFGIFPKLVDWLEGRAMKKSDKVVDKKMLGLFLFVAVPLPGTGGWMGALIASVLGFDIKKSTAVILAGVLTAEIIMLVLTYFLPGLFGFSF